MEDNTSRDYFDELYKRAVRWLSGTIENTNSTLPASVTVLLQELSVHKIELEMQNEELRSIHSNAETSKNKYMDLFEFAPVGYIKTDRHGRVLEANQTFCRLIDYDKTSVLKLPFIFFIASGDRDKYYNHLNRILKTESKDTCEIRLFRRKDIHRNVVLQSISMDDLGEKCCLSAVIELPEKSDSDVSPWLTEDIFKSIRSRELSDEKSQADGTKEEEQTERDLRKTLSELARSNKELEEFISIISHDLQEPVRMVEKLSLLLLDRYKGQIDPKGIELTQIIVDGAVRMRELVKELLNLSKITSKGQPFEWINTKEILKQCLVDLQVTIEQSNAVITFGSMPDIYADRIQIENLFQNLISNAVKYQKPGAIPEVQIGCGITGDEWIFSVKDNGIGINPQFHERIFRIFQRLHLAGEYEGSGVGLTLCQKIIDRHKGRIWVESEEGKGATFFFTIPKP